FMVLIQEDQYAPYFKAVVEILELQIASLGETSTDNPPFTCLGVKNRSGLHIDMSPAKNADLICTPMKLAELQNAEVEHPQNIENTVLKTVSLACSDETLFHVYQDEVKKILSSCREGTGVSRREARAMKFFKRRLKDFQERWQKPFNRQVGLFNI